MNLSFSVCKDLRCFHKCCTVVQLVPIEPSASVALEITPRSSFRVIISVRNWSSSTKISADCTDCTKSFRPIHAVLDAVRQQYGARCILGCSDLKVSIKFDEPHNFFLIFFLKVT